ncbi:EFR1 family ferrodoxin [Clostridium sp. YIM B02505]|uniref:EFR1 family ferrodoxin n=1 Tax=Clostridium yunnanense TaxID=2800325 RepID=A0ABS1ES22_9CLOT|nr:EFR1 family ferrodoxin [Clostridium yunnanense]MBK1812147.1 EFR1 family ferrodoxin [Clostridium yunnanense]
MKVLYFTATGNSLYIAKSFGGEQYSIPKLIKEGKFDFEDEKIGIVFPSYNTGVPKLVEEFLDKVKLNSKYIFGIVTYGMYAGGTTRHLLEIGERNHIKFSYVNEIVMVDNFLPGFDMDKQLEKLPKKKIQENLMSIVKDVKESKRYFKKHSIISSGIRVVSKKFMSHDNFQENFIVENNCNGCKTCEKVCPVNNIKVDKKPIFMNNCQSCLACTQNCPQNAIRLKNEKSRTRFKNENVTLKEIINANN